jgi:hypothetical protein
MADLVVGDPIRQVVRRALLWTLSLAALFTILTGPIKQISPWYSHAPWVSDPYDTVISFSMLFVPLVAIACAVRIPLCRRNEPAPRERIVDLVRSCWVLLGVAVFTLSVQWVAVVAGANHAMWNLATDYQISGLTVLSAISITASLQLRRIPLNRFVSGDEQSTPCDGLGDIISVAILLKFSNVRLSERYLSFVRVVDSQLVRRIRQHPLGWVAIVWAIVATALGTSQALNEGYSLGLATVFVLLLGGGMSSLTIIAGNYLGFVQGQTHLHGLRRRVLDGAIVAMIMVLIVFALRTHLWWFIDTTDARAGLAQLAVLLSVVGGVVFSGVVSVESLRRTHGVPASLDK